MDSVLLSTLECFYSNTDCLSIVLHFVNISFGLEIGQIGVPWFNVHPLVYDSTASRFTPQTLLSAIVREMMIEQWNQSFLFDRYYEVCAPSYCTFSYTADTQSFIRIIITLMSMIGGLSVALRFITYHLVNFIFSIIRRSKIKKQRRGNY
jgi:hypothetical protein